MCVSVQAKVDSKDMKRDMNRSSSVSNADGTTTPNDVSALHCKRQQINQYIIDLLIDTDDFQSAN